MKAGRVVIGMAIALVSYSIFVSQNALFGRILILDTATFHAFLISVLVFFTLSAFDRTRSLSYVLSPIPVVLMLDVILSAIAGIRMETGIYYVAFREIEPYLLIFSCSAIASAIGFTDNLRVQSILTFASLTIAGIASYVIVSTLSSTLAIPRLSDLAVPVLILLLTLALTSLANFSESLSFLRDQRAFLIFTIIAVSIYYILLKPLIGERVGIANFLEWLIVLLVILKIGRSIARVEVGYSTEVHAHRVDERAIRDEAYEAIEFAERMFLEKGVKNYLAAAIASAISATSKPGVIKAGDVIAPVVEYEDEKIPLLSFPWERRMIEMKNRRRREKVLNEVRRRLEDLR